MKKTIQFEMKHIKNQLANLSCKIDGTTTAGLGLLVDLAKLHDQLNSLSDHMKAL